MLSSKPRRWKRSSRLRSNFFHHNPGLSTKGGAGPGVQQAVESLDNNIGSINAVEEIANPAGNRFGSGAEPVEVTGTGSANAADGGLQNATNASSFGGFEAGVSPFGLLNKVTGAAGVVRSAPRPSTSGGAPPGAELPVEEGVTASVRTSRTGSGANLSELESEGIRSNIRPPKVPVNSNIPEINETPKNIPRR